MLQLKMSDINSYKFDYNLRRIHEYLFDDTNLKSQMKKYTEEYKEFENAKNREERIEELADCYIVAIGIERFDYSFGTILKDHIKNIAKVFEISEEEFYVAIVEKTKKLQERVWDRDNEGYYKHRDSE